MELTRAYLVKDDIFYGRFSVRKQDDFGFDKFEPALTGKSP